MGKCIFVVHFSGHLEYIFFCFLSEFVSRFSLFQDVQTVANVIETCSLDKINNACTAQFVEERKSHHVYVKISFHRVNTTKDSLEPDLRVLFTKRKRQ